MAAPKLTVGTFAINWYKPDSLPSVVASPNEAWAITFQTQTSMIDAHYDYLKQLYHFQISHKGKQRAFTVAEQVFGTDYGFKSVISMALDEYPPEDHDVIFKLLVNFWKIEDAEHLKPPVPLASGGWVDPEEFKEAMLKAASGKTMYLPNNADYSIQTHNYTFAKNPMYEGYNNYFPIYDEVSDWNNKKVGSSLAQKSYELPGVNEEVKHPIFGGTNTLSRTIINLNDEHKWTREQIADWVETLDINITFEPEVDTTFPVEYTEPNKEEQ